MARSISHNRLSAAASSFGAVSEDHQFTTPSDNLFAPTPAPIPNFSWDGQAPEWYIPWSSSQPDSDFDLTEQEAFDDFEWDDISQASFPPPLPLHRVLPTRVRRLDNPQPPRRPSCCPARTHLERNLIHDERLFCTASSASRVQYRPLTDWRVYTCEPGWDTMIAVSEARIREAKARLLLLAERKQSSQRHTDGPKTIRSNGSRDCRFPRRGFMNARASRRRVVLAAYQRKLRQEEHTLRRDMKGLRTQVVERVAARLSMLWVGDEVNSQR